jgi:predicted RNA-binding Zn-ribbon protein involved in translation (DUF1610 family)
MQGIFRKGVTRMKNIMCPVCGIELEARLAHGRKSNKPFIMMICPNDGRHFRAFITDPDYVSRVLKSLNDSENPEN